MNIDLRLTFKNLFYLIEWFNTNEFNLFVKI